MTTRVNILLLLAVMAHGLDSEFSNVQSGIRFKIMGLENDMPMIRIENGGNQTLAIRNNFYFALTLKKDNEKVKIKPREDKGFMIVSGFTRRASDEITLLLPKANLEIPMVFTYFNNGEDGYGQTLEWKNGLSLYDKGSYALSFTTNCLGITVIGVNFTPFRENFTIPDLVYDLK